ncbi:kinase-like domain [Cordyceps militaris]|uniref:Kinase-like domain n=1 Tax=Cordyceps militaris TaxID=73501 RepID=A0A2H4S598_CORMI|nr:kinase-like domain [Cordyceps militaris]
MSDPTDVAKLLQQLRQEQEVRQQAEDNLKQAEDNLKQAEEKYKQLTGEIEQAKNERDQQRQKTQLLTRDDTASTASADAKTPSSSKFDCRVPWTYANVDRSINGGLKRKEEPGQSGNSLSGSEDTPSPSSTERRNNPIHERRADGEKDGHDSHNVRDTHNGHSDHNDYDSRNNGNSDDYIPHRPQDSDYCTQKCLLGLVRGETLDLNCPNLARHCQNDGNSNQGNRHPISHDEFQQLLAVQLGETLDNGITPLDVEGARGVLFQEVYKRLEAVQGIHVPVFLGAIDLRSVDRMYFYAVRVDIVYLIFMSWAGVHIRKVPRSQVCDGLSLEDSAVQAMKAVHQQGVVHRDAKKEDMLFNPHTQRIMVIDFDRAHVVKPPRELLVAKKRQRVECDFRGEIASVKSVFL